MQFDWTDRIHHAKHAVFATRRDRLAALVAHMSNVVAIDRQGHESHANGLTVDRYRWQGAPSEVPLMFRPLIPAQMLYWFEHTRWDPSNYSCTWRIELPVLPEIVTAAGVNRYEADGDGTIVHMTGQFCVHPDKLPPVPGVPKMLVRRAAPQLEAWVVALLEPNLKEAHRAVERLLSGSGADPS